MGALWRKRWVVFLGLTLGLGGALAFLSQATPLYRSTSQILVSQNGPKIIDNSGLETGINPQKYFNTQVELIRSSAILNRAGQLPGVKSTQALAGLNPVVALRKLIDVSLGKDTDVITVSADTPKPEDAATLVNAVVMAYTEMQSEKRRLTASDVLGILKNEKRDAEAELDRIYDAVIKFKQENNTLGFEVGGGTITQDKLGTLSNALSKAQLDRVEAKVLLEAIHQAGDNLVQVQRLTNAFSREAQSSPRPGNPQMDELADLIRQRDALLIRVGPAHRDVQFLDQRIESLNASMSDASATILNELRQAAQIRYDAAIAQEAGLQAQYDEQRRTSLEFDSKTTQFAKFNSDMRRTEAQIDMLDNRIKQINITEDGGVMNVDVLEPAQPAIIPVWPVRSTVLLQGLVLGLMVGVSAALALELGDQRIRGVDELGQLGLSVLGVIPRMLASSITDRGRAVFLEPSSDLSEGYRTIRTSIYFGLPEGSDKTLLVTSPSPGDGKTTSASNLAITMAKAGRNVLLIDGDFRKPMQQNVFALGKVQGLADVLGGVVRVEDVIVKSDEIEGLSILPCGTLPANPAEALGSHRFDALLETLRAKFDHLVIDAPPILPVTDARVLATKVEAVILVLRAGKSTRRMAAHARDAITSVGGAFAGVVVNDVPRGKAGYDYSRYAYGYYYGSRYGGEKPKTLPDAVRKSSRVDALVHSTNGSGHHD
jgi:capsular exopolysaccharide synthesis family protein